MLVVERHGAGSYGCETLGGNGHALSSPRRVGIDGESIGLHIVDAVGSYADDVGRQPVLQRAVDGGLHGVASVGQRVAVRLVAVARSTLYQLAVAIPAVAVVVHARPIHAVGIVVHHQQALVVDDQEGVALVGVDEVQHGEAVASARVGVALRVVARMVERLAVPVEAAVGDNRRRRPCRGVLAHRQAHNAVAPCCAA